MTDVAHAYAARAAEYADVLGAMSAVHPSDRQLVDAWASTISGRVLDAGCGPGHWTDHLRRSGIDVHGIDVVPAFIQHARSAFPETAFAHGSIDAIDEPDASVGGILSWFSTIHHEPSRLQVPLAEFARVLRPGGTLLLGYFDGAELEAFDHAVVRAYRWPLADLSAALESAGFTVVDTQRRAEQAQRPVGAIVAERRGL